MFAHTLQRAKGPAESLRRERAQAIGGFGPGNCVFFVANVMTHATNAQRQVLILR